MTEGDVVLIPLPEVNGPTKPRPAVLLRQVPHFSDWLVCGISTQLPHKVVDFDELIEPIHADFDSSGLKAPSVIQLSSTTVLPESKILGSIGSISYARHERLLRKLSTFLAPA